MALFQRTLGVLVETGPGVFGFLHLSFAEYFAARELLRSGALEALASDPERVFRPEWREVLLLAAGELGVMRAEDQRLTGLVDRVLVSARAPIADPAEVAALVQGLLADDPGLMAEAAEKLIESLILNSWRAGGFELEWFEAIEAGRWRKSWTDTVSRILGEGVSPDESKTSAPRVLWMDHWLRMAHRANLDLSPAIVDELRRGRVLRAVVAANPDRAVVRLPGALFRAPEVDGRAVWLRTVTVKDVNMVFDTQAWTGGHVMRLRDVGAYGPSSGDFVLGSLKLPGVKDEQILCCELLLDPAQETSQQGSPDSRRLES